MGQDMKLPLFVRPEAQDDMVAASNWYQYQRDGLDKQFLQAVDEVIDRIRETPEIYAPGYKSIRRAGVHRFPYIIYYRLINNEIHVIAVQHGSRNPRRWRLRANT